MAKASVLQAAGGAFLFASTHCPTLSLSTQGQPWVHPNKGTKHDIEIRASGRSTSVLAAPTASENRVHGVAKFREAVFEDYFVKTARRAT